MRPFVGNIAFFDYTLVWFGGVVMGVVVVVVVVGFAL